MALSTEGQWGEVFDTEIMGIHQVLLGDGRVLYWGDDGQGNAFSNTQKFAIYDPTTGTYEVVTESYVVRMFCGAGVIIPGTDQVLIAGGNGIGLDDGKVFDTSDESLDNFDQYIMADGRFYPTMVSLSTGQLVILGGNSSGGVGTPEVFTLNEGWKQLTGAFDADVATNWWYPKTWVNNKGEVLYIALSAGNQNGGTNEAGTFELMALDISGDGSIRQVAEVPFQMDVRSTAVMYDIGKIAVMDHVGDLWLMDINNDTPTFTFAADLPTDRENGDMTVMADGRILLNGGTTTGNSQAIEDAVFQSVIFDPFTGDVTFVDSEAVLRLYHSSSLLLPDGTIISSGGGGLNSTLDFQDAQIYSPDYLFNDDGTLADRPVISAAPEDLVPGETFVITVDDAATIARLSFVKTGAVTHSTNMESGRMDLEFNVVSPTQIEVTLPENPHVVGAGNWMLFAIDADGVPSVAPIISVLPTLEPFEHQDGALTAEYFVLDTAVVSLDQIDFDQTADFTEDARIINFNTFAGTAFEGGPSNNFAAKYTGPFNVASDGNYTFYLTSDDGARLYIDGQLVIDNDGVHAARELSATVNLTEGAHTIEVHYFEAAGSATLDLDWAGPGFSRQQMQFEETILTSIETNGDVELALNDDNEYVLLGSNGIPIVLREFGVPIGPDTFDDFTAIQAEEGPNGGFRVLWEGFGNTEYTWDVDASGNFIQEVRRTDINEVETLFEVDLDGDGVIGPAPEEPDPILASDLVDENGGINRFDGAELDTGAGIVNVDGDPVTSAGWQGWKDASNGGQISINTDGRVQFRDNDGDFATLPDGDIATTAITFTVSDGAGGTRVETASFDIQGTFVPAANTDPDAVDDVNGPVLSSDLADRAKIDGENVLSNDTDAEGNVLTITSFGGQPIIGEGWQSWQNAADGGQFNLNTDGRVVFRDQFDDFAQLPQGEQATTSITYTVSDGNGGTDTATITYVIDGTYTPGVNAAPVAADDLNGPILATELVVNNAVQKIDGDNVLTNDSDANGDTLSIIAINGDAVTSPGWQGWRDASNGGQIALNSDGRVQFRDIDFDFANLGPGEVVDTSIDYTISDGNGGTDTATVTFSITQDDILLLENEAIEIIG